MRVFHGTRLAAVVAGLLVLIAFAGCPRPAREVVVAPATPPPAPTPPPPPYVPNKLMETGRMFNGMQVNSTVETTFGTTASAERVDAGSYTLDLQLKVRVPKPHKDLAAIARLNERLPEVLPGLPGLMDTARVSPFFEELYRLKVANLQRNLVRLDNLLSRHNFYDTETVLDLEHPVSKRRAVLVQSEMDVDMDGSDSDRVPEIDGSSVHFQPFTSYRWPKKTSVVNSFITPRESRVKQLAMELAAPGVRAAKQQELKSTQARLKGEITDLQKNSYLVASTDPFIVLPGSMVGKTRQSEWSPLVGDYCVIIHGGMLYPAIVGDVGPTYKSGEASLRLCKQLNPNASAVNRPVSDLKVTYLVFPNSGDKPWQPPDLAKWREQCEKLLGEMGGYSGELFAWEDMTKKAPPPEPTVPPAATPAPATPAPAATATASAQR